MTTYLQSFRLPIEEESLITKRMAENGGAYGYIDNAYPCGLFGSKGLYEVHFRDITIFFAGVSSSSQHTLLFCSPWMGQEYTIWTLPQLTHGTGGNWKNSKVYFDFFKRHESLFLERNN